jgi:hypothetical protein
MPPNINNNNTSNDNRIKRGRKGKQRDVDSSESQPGTRPVSKGGWK